MISLNRPLSFNGRFDLFRRLGSLKVVDSHRLIDHLPGLQKVSGDLQQIFILENAVDPRCQGILAYARPWPALGPRLSADVMP
jgi:hypothetical protein